MKYPLENPPDIVTSEVAEFMLTRQRRCILCGSTLFLEIHHRLPRSLGEYGLHLFLQKVLPVYRASYQKRIEPWNLHSIENLVVLCRKHHTGEEGVHSGNRKLYDLVMYSFTCRLTGFNISYKKPLLKFPVYGGH